MGNSKSFSFYHYLFFLGYYLSGDLRKGHNFKDSELSFVTDLHQVSSFNAGYNEIFWRRINGTMTIFSVDSVVIGFNY